MINISRSIEVNGGDGAPLSVDDVWRGLVAKAENPMVYVPDITACTIVERFDGGLIRDIINFGKSSRELVTFYPKERVHFVRMRGDALGTIDNEITLNEKGEPALTFSFRLAPLGAEPGSAEEAAFGEMMSESYLDAVRTTLVAIREGSIVG